MTVLEAMRRLARPLLVTLVLGGVIAVLGVTPAGAQTDDVNSNAVYDYRIDLDSGELHVTAEIGITADKPNRSTSRGVTQFYFTGYYFSIPQEVADLSITQDGLDLDYELVEETEFAQTIEFSFRKNIFYHQTANVIISYTVDGSVPRSESLTRVNGAYAGFAIWGDPTIERSQYNVYLPEGFSVSDQSSLRFKHRMIEGETVLRDSTTIDEAEFYWELLSLRNDDALVRSELEVDGHLVEIRAWPGDNEWLDFATETAESGIPALVDLVGVDWPIDGTLTIAESYSPYLAGYGGWYSKDDDSIEVGDQLDSQTLLHEISHVWFNGDLFSERWITEGLADVYASRASEVISDEKPDEPKASQFDAAARPLSKWSQYGSIDNLDTEGWSYEAAWTVTEQIVDEIGLEAMGDVLAATSDDVISYWGENDPEAAENARSWRSYLDLLEHVGGAEDVDEIFADWVVSSTQQPQLDRRAETLPAFEALRERSDVWAMPLIIRMGMDAWSFRDVDELILEAEAILDVRDETRDLADEFSLVIPADAEEAYQDADVGLEEAMSLTEQTRAATQTLVSGIEKIEADRALTTRIGLIGADPEVVIDEAIEAYEANDFELAADKAAEAEAIISDAGSTGTTRLALAAGGLLLLVVGLGLRRRRRNKTAPASSTDASTDEADQAAAPIATTSPMADGEIPEDEAPDDMSDEMNEGEEEEGDSLESETLIAG